MTISLFCSSFWVVWSADFNKGLDAYLKGDYTTALTEFKPLAEGGDKDSQYLLGSLYADGAGVIQDYKMAFKWYILSAEQGHSGSHFELGVLYFFGKGVLEDIVYAHMWANIASLSGDDEAINLKFDLQEKMTPSQIEKAVDLARECFKKNYKAC